MKQVFDDATISKVGFIVAGGQFVYTDQLGDRSREYVSIPPLVGPDGYQGSFYDPLWQLWLLCSQLRYHFCV